MHFLLIIKRFLNNLITLYKQTKIICKLEKISFIEGNFDFFFDLRLQMISNRELELNRHKLTFWFRQILQGQIDLCHFINSFTSLGYVMSIWDPNFLLRKSFATNRNVFLLLGLFNIGDSMSIFIHFYAFAFNFDICQITV